MILPLRRLLLTASLALAVVSSAALGVEPAGAPPTSTDLPVRSVALFSSGVGYFEHAGAVVGDGAAELQFRSGQINDVLKSLVLQDLGGGTVRAVVYPSQDPIARILKSFQLDLTGNPPLADVLNQLRGARVTVSESSETLSGTVVGVEVRQRPAGDKGELAPMAFLNLLTGPSLRSLALDQVRELRIDDPKLRDELGRALDALSQARDQDKKPVRLELSGSGERRVRVGYVVETPVWKTSYRLLLPPQAEGKPLLQGWAIVENQTDSDWSGVRLTLVSGRPLSFVQDLYRPLYAPRPVVQTELYANLKPQAYDAGLEAEEKDVQAFAAKRAEGGRARKALALPSAGYQSMMAPGPGAVADTPLDAASSVASLAATAKVGALFQYTVEEVSLPRQQSAMLPIVADPVEAERLAIYNPAVVPRNPLSGARLKNTTGKHLLQGPVTVFDGGAYAGDARLDDVPPGQQRLLSYGIDQEVLVDATQGREESAVQTGKIVKGVLWITRKNVAVREYRAENKGDRDKTLVIEHVLRPGWKLVEPAKADETTDALYRFEGKVAAGKTTKLTVREELVRDESFALLASDPGQLAFYGRTGELPKAVRDALAKAAQLRQAVAETDREIARRATAVDDIGREQERIRQNLAAVSADTQYHGRLVAKLNEQETAIEKLQAEREELQKKRDGQQRELEQYLGSLTVG
ncbi:MAG: hypothetical protein HZB55_16325 [Deltaproteobacteria bacterium]|nr:hypothetical protein [Deltaproteobacteria bacterium]